MKDFIEIKQTKLTVKQVKDFLSKLEDDDIITINGILDDTDLKGEYEKVYRFDSVLITEYDDKKNINVDISFYHLEKL